MPNELICHFRGAGGRYLRHIRISRDAMLLDLHKAIVSAGEMKDVKQPSFVPIRRTGGQKAVKHSTNRTKSTAPIWVVAPKDMGLPARDTLVYRLARPSVQFDCRVIRELEEPTPQPLVVRASEDAYGWRNPRT